VDTVGIVGVAMGMAEMGMGSAEFAETVLVLTALGIARASEPPLPLESS
jgi:hypothetical protein